MPAGSDPSTRTGPCRGYKCHCKAYDQAKSDRVWPVCACRHVQQTHANPEGLPAPSQPDTIDT